MTNKRPLTYAVLGFCLACSGSDIIAYTSYLNDPANGLIQVNATQNARYTIQYRPVDLMVYLEVHQSGQEESQVRNEIEGLDYFFLQIQNDNVTSGEADFYYAYELQMDIFQLVASDTIRPSIFLLEQGLGGSGSYNINLGFPTVESDLIIHCHDRFGAKVQLTFSRNDISNMPKLRI